MEKRLNVFVITVGILAIFLSACGGTTKNPFGDDLDPAGEGLPPVTDVKAREALSVELGVEIEEITIVSHEQMTWSDSCLGLGGIAESCLQTEVKGWQVELSVVGMTYKAHTDWMGDQIRFEP